MNRKYVISFFIMLITCSSYSQGALKKQKITKELSMEIPTSFVSMDLQQQRLKYVSSRTPIAMFTTMDGNIDMGINTTSTRWGSGDLDILLDFYKAGILNLYDQVKFYQDTIKMIDDRPFIIFEFVGTVTGEDNSFSRQGDLSKYIYIQYTLYNETVLLFNFSAPALIKSKWETIVEEMMNSIKLK